MRGLASRLGRAAPNALRNLDSLWGPNLEGSPSLLVTQLISLRPLQHLQCAAFSAYKKPPSDDDDDDAEELKKASRKGHLPRVSHGSLRQRVPSTVAPPVAVGADQGTSANPSQRQEKIRDLLRTMAGGEDNSGAFRFVDSFFEPKIVPSITGASLANQLAAAGLGDDTESMDGEDADADAFAVSTQPSLDDEQEEEVLAELRGLRRGSQRVVLQKLLQGGMLRADPAAMAEWQEIQAAFKPPEGFRMKVVDVNRTCKGTRSGGLYRFSAMVVVGNGEGVLGWGQGKAAEVNEAVRKAYQRACRNLYPIPRFNRHTIPEGATAKFGKVKIVMYPKSSGRGIVASTLVSDICKLAGIHDIGVKIHGSRNPRNLVKCLFEAFDGMKTHEEILAAVTEGGRKVTVAVPPGRFGRLAV